MLSRVKKSLKAYERALRKKRIGTGDFYKRLVFDLAGARNGILKAPDPRLRDFLGFAMALGPRARGQIFQDAFVLYVLGARREGFFVDFGATDGLSLSNSYLLETGYGWRGICAEPARGWHEDLRANRPGAIIETRCVWERTGARLTFSQVEMRELSTLTDFAAADGHAKRRRDAETFEVETISLDDMLAEHGAPEGFDYLSIDTEGSELAILTAFDMARYRPKVVTVEHNHTPNRDKLYTLLTGHGYTRVMTEVSLFDDWYLAPGVALPEIA